MSTQFNTPEKVDASVDAALLQPASDAHLQLIDQLLAAFDANKIHMDVDQRVIVNGAILRAVDRVYAHLATAALAGVQ